MTPLSVRLFGAGDGEAPPPVLSTMAWATVSPGVVAMMVPPATVTVPLPRAVLLPRPTVPESRVVLEFELAPLRLSVPGPPMTRAVPPTLALTVRVDAVLSRRTPSGTDPHRWRGQGNRAGPEIVPVPVVAISLVLKPLAPRAIVLAAAPTIRIALAATVPASVTVLPVVTM